MSAPTKQVEEAKAALKKRFLEMLVKDKDKSEKIEKLLAKSPEYRSLLGAATAEVMQIATSHGHSDTQQTRTSAEKIAQTDVQKIMSELRGSVPEELRTRLGENLQQLELMKRGITDATHKADGALVALRELKQWEFMTNPATAGIIKLKLDDSKLAGISSNIHEKHETIEKLEESLTEAISSDDEDELRRAVRKSEEQVQSLRVKIATATQDVAKVLRGLTATVNTKALDAYIEGVVKKGQLEKLEESKEFVDKAIGIIGAIFKASEATETINRAARLINTAIHTYARERVITEGGKEHLQEHTQAEVRSGHDDDPLLMARRMFEQQKRALDLFLQTLGVTLSGALIAAHGAGEIVMKVWDPIADSIAEGLSSMLEARLDQAEKALEAKNPTLAAQAQTDESKSLEEKVASFVKKGLEKLGEKAAEKVQELTSGGEDSGGESGAGAVDMLQKIVEDPAKIVTTVLGWIMKPLMKKIWEIFPPKPAQTVSGTDLTNMLNQIHIAQLPIDMAVAGHAPRVAPTITSLDTKPSDIDQSAWDQFEEVNAGRTEWADDPARRRYHVSVLVPDYGNVKVWGTFDPRTKQFAPTEIDPAAIDDWYDRTVAGGGYTDGPLVGGEPAVQGTWQIVTVGQYQYVALTAGGTRHWGGFADNTRGPRGTASQLGTVVSELRTTTRATMAGFPIGQ